jgi:hypothetical protein
MCRLHAAMLLSIRPEERMRLQPQAFTVEGAQPVKVTASSYYGAPSRALSRRLSPRDECSCGLVVRIGVGRGYRSKSRDESNQMDNDLQARIKFKLREFLRRDYPRDVDRLNSALGKAGDAGFTRAMPPIPFAGNPFALRRGNCIAVFGINPKWGGWDANRCALRDCIDSFRRGDEESFNEFLKLRASEFEGGSYYGRYYTKLGNHLFREWFQGKISTMQEGQDAAKEVFRNYVLKADLLPWFSENTNKINAKAMGSSNDPALLAYHEIISLLFCGLKPRWIQFNGLQMLDLIEAITEAKLKRIKICERMYIWVGQSNKLIDTPILVHGFVNSIGGPQTEKQFKKVTQAFCKWIGNDAFFDFQ